MIRRIAAVTLVLSIFQVVCLTDSASAEVPQLLNYQGRLTDADGKPVNGSKEMVFEFYDEATDGNLLSDFSEMQQVTVTNGIFNVLIGSATDGGVPVSVFEGASLYLSVRVGEEALSPRQRITSVAYAIRSADSAALDGVPGFEIHVALAGLLERLVALEVMAGKTMHAPMAYIPAGRFTTSTGVNVYLGAYCIDIYEITNALYCQFLESGGNDDFWHSSMNGEITRTGVEGNYTYSVVAGFEQRPVRWVTWYDAVVFCDWRSEAEGLPDGTYNLPTEAQWEKAAGWEPPAGKLWTYGFQSDSITSERANYANNIGTTTDVGGYHPWRSYYGLYDASGNLWEWCRDWYQLTYPSGTSDPTGPASGDHKIVRGGSYPYGEVYCRVSTRSYYSSPAQRLGFIGFRCARSVE